jgi:cell division septation protein DedD
MASGRKSGGGGERIVEGRHVIGLFVLMLLFSGVFFTLGYVMGRNQYGGQVRAATDSPSSFDFRIGPRAASQPDRKPKRSGKTDVAPDAAVPPASDWEFYHAGEAGKANDHLKPADTAPKPSNSAPRSPAPPKMAAAAPKANGSRNAPVIPAGAYLLQVAALTRESDALALAETLQRKKFPAFVASPGADKFCRVQVGPFADAQSAAVAKKDLENAGFKAIVKH